MKIFNVAFLVFILMLFSACSGKELKKYGGNLAVNGGGNPLMVGTGLVVGGAIYGVGLLVDNEKENKEIKEKD